MKKVLFALLMGLSLAAIAKDDGNDFAACKADFERLCKDVKPGDGRQVRCMMDNKARTSPQCQAVLAKKEEKDKQWKANKQVKHEQQAKHQKP